MSITYTTAKNGKTDIVIGKGIIADAARYVCTGGAVRAAVVTDSNVAPLHLDKLLGALQGKIELSSHVLSAGEQYKNMSAITELYSFFDDSGITRTDVVIALGGGVVGDITGFAAATFLRGVRLVQVPTTLLAMTDSSIGGKTGVDLPSGKNRAGAFHQPSHVLIDPELLDTLPQKEMACGMAEVIKYACIKDAELARELEGDIDITRVIEKCVSIKAGVVQNDQFDSGERKLLNYGHTLGHAIEKLQSFSGLSHGEAISVGMCMFADVNIALGGCPEEDCVRNIELCKKYNLPTSVNINVRDIVAATGADKKMEGKTLKLVVLEKMGKARVVDCTLKELEELLCK
ncbi:MAG: 3-dehydroquinate synthase [Clostridia bacterium]|nr:3-dehydroquinate synthase [Clostridia bacterium]